MKKILAIIAAVAVLGGGGATAAVLLSNQSRTPAVTASLSAPSYTIEYMPSEQWGNSTQIRWGPELFAQSSDVFNYDLALVSAALSAAAYGNGTGNYIVNAYETLGFSKMAISLYGYPDNKELNNLSQLKGFDDSSLAFSIASKSLEGVELVVITLRGTKTDPGTAARNLDIDAFRDWGTNLHFAPVNFLGVKAHAGFNDFCNDVLRGWNDHMERHPSLEDKKVKILITGHSLGGAAANMLGAFFNSPENMWANEEDIYVYTLAAPKTYEGKSPTTTSCNNIFNIINKKDQVPTLLGGKWFGREMYFSEGDKVSWDGHPQQLYIAKIKEMRDADPAIVEMEASFAASKRAEEESSRAVEQASVESSRAAEEKSRLQAEEESRRQEEQRKLDAVKPKNTFFSNTTDRFGYYYNYTLEIGSWIKASDTEMLNAAWRAVGGTGSFPSMSDMYRKMSGYYAEATAFNQRTSAVVFGRLTRSSNGTLNANSWPKVKWNHNTSTDAKKRIYDLGGCGLFYEGDNGYIGGVSAAPGSLLSRQGHSMPIAIVFSQVFTPAYPNGYPDIQNVSFRFGEEYFTIGKTW